MPLGLLIRCRSTLLVAGLLLLIGLLHRLGCLRSLFGSLFGHQSRESLGKFSRDLFELFAFAAQFFELLSFLRDARKPKATPS